MSDKKTKIDCRLTTRGSEAVNAKAIDDLSIPDPELAIGEQIIKLQSELQSLVLRLRNDDRNPVTHEGPVIPMSEAEKIALEIRDKRAEILDLQTRR